jgi:MFS family permease
MPMNGIAPDRTAGHPTMDIETDRANLITALLPIMGAVLVAFLIIGLALPVLPLHVHQDLGLGTVVVGLVTGSQFVASLLSRVWSGHYADSRGAKRAVIIGLLIAAVAGLLYLLSLRFLTPPWLSAAIVLLGRAMLGVAESFIITGAVAWGLALAGPERAGRVIAWIGMAMFAALALGAPLGTALYGAGGFAAVALATMLVPLGTVLFVALLPSVPTRGGAHPSLLAVAGAIWMPGLGAALASIGFGAIIAFGALLAAERGWSPVWLIFSAFATGLIFARLLFGGLPDRLGGARVALVCVLIEAAGLALIWLAPSHTVATVGAALAGFGYSLVYPGLGVEAVRRAPPPSRGVAMGAYTACLDVAIGFGGPALGLAGGWAGLDSVFLASGLITIFGAAIALHLVRRQPHALLRCASGRAAFGAASSATSASPVVSSPARKATRLVRNGSRIQDAEGKSLYRSSTLSASTW